MCLFLRYSHIVFFKKEKGGNETGKKSFMEKVKESQRGKPCQIERKRKKYHGRTEKKRERASARERDRERKYHGGTDKKRERETGGKDVFVISDCVYFVENPQKAYEERWNAPFLLFLSCGASIIPMINYRNCMK